ncbi:MAG TPA: hypothetical protein VHB73_01915 [Alphaproteobacteria bacterium]|nr:hypothetical protein [Alphaproteobacteria bacterium]
MSDRHLLEDYLLPENDEFEELHMFDESLPFAHLGEVGAEEWPQDLIH